MEWMTYLAQIASVTIPVLVPMVVAGLKKAMGKVPTAAIPLVAVGIGAGLDAATAWLGHNAPSSWGVLAGLAGIGIREIKDQLFPAKRPA